MDTQKIQSSLNTTRRWYDKKRFILPLLIFMFPVGLYALWKGNAFSKGIKIGISAVYVLFFLMYTGSVLFVINNPNNQAVDNNLPDRVDMVAEEVTVIEEGTVFTPNTDISTENISDNEIKVSVKTSFPESTSLTIGASRDYKRTGIDDQYAIDLYSNNLIVKNGQVTFNFNPNDKKYIKEYEELRKRGWEFDKTLTEIDRKSIKDTIEISVLFTPRVEQPKSVINLTGVNGENLNGAGVETTDYGFKVYDKKIKLYHKFQN